ncbi:MAG: 16S rRNA (uracil(1498)-N(3))-methyltransferase [Burkholderiales bacterium]
MKPHKTKKQLKSGARFYLDRKIEENETLIDLPKEITRHATSALRLKVGALFTLFDNDGSEYISTLVTTPDGQIKADVLQFLDSKTESKLKVSLTQSILSNEKMSLVVQKATELGITEINVCKTDRSSISIETDQLKKRKVHWRRVAIAACEQSGRTQIPKINTFLSLTSCLEELPAENTEQTKLILSPQGSTRLKDISVSPANLNIAVGPEGGFSDDEIAFAKSTGFIEFQTGPRTLRAETAGISMAAIAQALWGDF